MKREQNHVARSLPKKPSGLKHIVCHHCGAFGHLRHHCSKFQALKKIKRKEKLKLLGSCALQTKPNLIESGESVYIPSHKRNQKVERNTLKPKPPFRS